MDGSTVDEGGYPAEEVPFDGIERKHTGLRILLTILFALIWSVLEAALAVIVVFSLVFALATRQAPPLRLREFSNRLVAYAYRVWRYITYNDARVPFPFSDFPGALEGPGELGRDEAFELRDEREPPEAGE